MPPHSFRNLTAYKKAFDLAMAIFSITKKFPKEEKYSMFDQIRRSSRSVVVCIAEAYRKRHYPQYFVSKSSDADMENSETRVWLEFAEACSYIDNIRWLELDAQTQEIGRLLNHMINHPEKYQQRSVDN
jgi:four helix bundle protein